MNKNTPQLDRISNIDHQILSFTTPLSIPLYPGGQGNSKSIRNQHLYSFGPNYLWMKSEMVDGKFELG